MLSKSPRGKTYSQNPMVPRSRVHLFSRVRNGKNLLRLQRNAARSSGSKLALSCAHRSKKVREPTLHAAGTECLQASRCTLLLPEVSGEPPPRLRRPPLLTDPQQGACYVLSPVQAPAPI